MNDIRVEFQSFYRRAKKELERTKHRETIREKREIHRDMERDNKRETVA